VKINLIVAVDKNGGFGKEGKIPWHFKCDFKHFQNMTKGHICVMGRTTYEDMAEMMKARGKDIKDGILPERKSYMLSSVRKKAKGVTVAKTLQEVIDKHPDEEIWILGGERLFKEGLDLRATAYVTVIDNDYKCDRFFPVETLQDYYNIVDGRREEENSVKLMFMKYEAKPK